MHRTKLGLFLVGFGIITDAYMENSFGKILMIDDDEDVLLAGKLLLKKHAHHVLIEKNPKKIPFLLNNDTYDVIMLDMNFTKDITSGKEGFYWLEQIREQDPDAVVILMTAFGDVDTAVKALKSGATDFVLKPWQNEKLLATIGSAIKLRESYKEVDKLKKAKEQLEADLNEPFQNIIGDSKPMEEVFHLIERVSETDANVLILGENGTGKELVARAIHQSSKRKKNVFVGVDLGAITESLFESEMFGHLKGAFTDAKEDRAGRFEVASGGTLFLDEMGNLSVPVQSKLLTALESRMIHRVGSNRSQEVDIRLICATNMDLDAMVTDQSFRQDLLYRINTVEIRLPALRERLEDLPLLVKHFLEKYNRKYRKTAHKITPNALRVLQKYPWPGNIRELEHALERAIIMTDHEELSENDFFFLKNHSEGQELITKSLRLEDVERAAVEKVIRMHKGNISKAAEELGLTRASLYRRMEKYGI